MGIIQRKIVAVWLFCLAGIIASQAQPLLKTTIDKKEILIGEQIRLKIEASIPPQDFFVKWIRLPDSLPHVELLGMSKIDSSFKQQHLSSLSQTITFTSFDSGKWVIPAFNIDFNPSNGDSSYNLYTDSFIISVRYQTDTANIVRDIKDIREATDETAIGQWIAIAAGIVLLLALAVGIYWYMQKRKRLTPAMPALSPYQLALQQMEQLQAMNLSDAGEVKQFHTRLGEIIKQYLSSIHGPACISSTTAEVLTIINQKGIDKTTMAQVSDAMRQSDAAKFAKFIPSAAESQKNWLVIKQAIDFSEKIRQQNTGNGN